MPGKSVVEQGSNQEEMTIIPLRTIIKITLTRLFFNAGYTLAVLNMTIPTFMSSAFKM